VEFGEGRPDTRGRVSVDRLRARESPEIFDRTLTQLAAPEHRLITLSGSPDEQERMVELAHDALIGAWPRFQEWLEEFRVDERTRRDVERDVREWRDRVDDPSRLYEGSQLAEAHTWAAANQQDVDRDTDTFLKASDRRAGRRRSARVTLGALVLAFTLIGVGATGYVVRQAVLNQSARGETVDFQAVSARLGSGPSPDLTTYRGVDTVVNVPAFSLDRYEVTNGQYRRCVDAGFCTQPSEPAETVSYTVAGDDLPVVWVTAYQAARFCDWIGRRLPTEMEWERAARGADGRAWPWGNDPPSPTRANVILEAFPPTSDPALVSVRDPAYAMGATPEGVAHLLGNAWEWTASPRECTNPYACPGAWNGHDPVSSLYARGLSFRVPLSDIDVGGSARATLGKSWLLDGYYADADLGFRCASTRG
jgi:formylglycine-generating enzyme required for sulfatase activity